MERRGRWPRGLFVVLSLALTAAPAHAAIEYIHDDLGRLIAVVDPAQGVAVYTYDAVGNLLSIARHGAGLVSVLHFTPRSGPAGTVVTIQGTGFSTTPSQNAVTFDGAAATVTSATATELVATVPAGATTGVIGVTSPAGTAASSVAFTVTATSGAPTVTGFTPSVGTPGTAVTIAGTNFEVPHPTNRVTFNATRAYPTSSTATTIGTSVPPATGSGRVTVATPLGTAVSAADFFVPPAPYTAADVDFTGRVAIGGSIIVSIPTTNHIGLVVFDGVAGQRLGLETRAGTIASAELRLYSPTGVLLRTQAVGVQDQVTDAGTLPTTGTYSVMIDPCCSYTGNVTLRPGLADLQVPAASAPPSVDRANNGTYQFPISWTVQNFGTASAYPLLVFNAWNWQDRVYLSTDATYDAGDVQVLSQPRATPLAPGASYTVSTTAMGPAMAPGTYYVLFVADHLGQMPETIETNNTRVVGPITLLGAPDLVPTAFTGPTSVPRSNTGTYSLPVSWTVANQGQSATPMGAYDYIYLSTDATWDAADTYLTGVYTPPPLAAGASYTKNQTVATGAVAAGTYYLILRADASAFVSESNEGNNTRVLGPLTLLAGADLVPTALTGPTAPVPRNANGSYTLGVSWTIENQGPSPTPVSVWNDRIYLSTDATWEASDSAILTVSRTTPLAAAASYTETRPSVTTGVVTPGSYYLIVRTDADGFVSEADETNNTRVYGPLTLSP